MSHPYLLTPDGNIINVSKRFSQNFGQYVRSMSNTPRFRGLGLGPSDYGVLHHIVACGMLLPLFHPPKDRVYAFWKGILHELGETFWGDIPTPFKDLVPEIRQSEVRIAVKFSENLAAKWPGYYGQRMAAIEYKEADSLLCAIEAELVLGCPRDVCDEAGLGSDSEHYEKAERLVADLIGFPPYLLERELNELFRISLKKHIDSSSQLAYVEGFGARIMKYARGT